MTEPTAEQLKDALDWLRTNLQFSVGWLPEDPAVQSLAALLASREQALREERDAAEAKFKDWSGTDVPALNIALTASRQMAYDMEQRAEAAEARVRELELELSKTAADHNRAVQAEARRELQDQKSALVAARVALTECVGQAATVLYRESAKDKPSRDALRAEAKRLDGFLLTHRVVGFSPRPGTEADIRQSEREACERIVDEAIDDIGLKREVLSRFRERDK